jgi:hypothetical protein
MSTSGRVANGGLRGVAALGTVVGLLTGVGTIVGWVTTASFVEALDDVVPFAGRSYAMASILLIAADPWVPQTLQPEWWPRLAPRDHAWQRGRPFKCWWTMTALLAAVFVALQPQGVLFTAFGFIALALGVLAALKQAARAHLRRRAAHKPCPDCAEQVNADARVCPYCKWRFAPRPAGEHWPRTHSPSNGDGVLHETPYS